MTGFTITLDALVAIVVAASIVTASAVLITGRHINQDDYIIGYARDFLAVADKSGTLDAFIAGNSTHIREIIQDLPNSVCLELDVYNEDWHRLSDGHAQNVCEASNKVFIVSRIVIHDMKIYPVTAKVWYNEHT